MEPLPAFRKPGAKRIGIKDGFVGRPQRVYAEVLCKPREGKAELCAQINECTTEII